ncbi:MAG TPA: MBL fold metallo-hydrolase [Bryobacteraceae bacterium]|jgi:glyoxylase-like metal-dependent hydrolase (beta-lactamase superfamily II)
MTRRILVCVGACALFLVLAWIGYTQNQTQPGKLTVNKVHDDLYEIEGDGGNVAVLVTNEGVILVDDKFEYDHDSIINAVKSVTPQPIKYIINTHYHQDHSGGNAKFLPIAEVISTQNARTNILAHKQSNVTGSPVSPARIVFTDETAVFLGGKEVRAKYFGRGHTNGDAVVYFPADRTIHTGDLMAGTSPLIDYNGGGSLVEWTKTLDAAMKLDFDTVIPGHGAVTNKAGLLTYRNNVEKMRNEVRGLIRSGKSQADVAQYMTMNYNWAPNSLQQQWSVPGMVKELK